MKKRYIEVQSLKLDDSKINVKVKLSALWIVMMFLYVYADILSLYRPGQIDEIRGGMMGPLEVSQMTLLAASAVVIVPAIMVFLSLVMNPAVSRWTNIILGLVFTLVNTGNLIGEGWAYYQVFGGLEIVLTLFIIKTAWQWPKNIAALQDH